MSIEQTLIEPIALGGFPSALQCLKATVARAVDFSSNARKGVGQLQNVHAGPCFTRGNDQTQQS
jgi:hypothetical protein